MASVDYNYWWNGAVAMPDPGDGTWLVHGPNSTYTGMAANPDPGLVGLTLDMTSVANLAVSARANLRPRAGSPLLGKALASATGFIAHDGAGAMRPAMPAIGALEP
jgi:hypothetical protein